VTSVSAASLAEYLDQLLHVPQHADYPQALNGLQLANRSSVRRIAAAVDLSLPIIQAARLNDVNFLIVHHGMFWGGLQRIVGPQYDRLRALLDADIAVYSVHLPLDSHSEFGNSLLLARRLGLNPSGSFAKYAEHYVGVSGEADVATTDLVNAVVRFAAEFATTVRTTNVTSDQRTRRWAICTGAGASTETLREAASAGIDTLLVGEGPHHTAVEAAELGITVIYAGHYATETLGVQAIAARASQEYGVAWQFLPAPTGL
jgi:dinuclear metal center YbgI/SA1388 family protein